MSALTVPWREPIIDRNGNLTPSWVIFYNELLARVGGSGTTPDLSQIITLIEQATQVIEFQAFVPQDAGIQQAMRKIAELEALIPQQPDLNPIRRKLEELEGMILDIPAPYRPPTVEAWIAPTLLNSWVNFGGGFNNAGYYKDLSGVVHLRGMVKSGVIGNAVFNLPAGYRPANEELFVAISNGALGRVDIYPSGDVGATSGSNSWLSLDGMTFRAA
ncbi:hypothetical protein E5S69_31495 [Cupriavidus necator]|uniref:hypothetical protein n=1 Tax=Cupriavidus necator TaxID=106590 RepID=UPI0014901CAA|nr:hypothetical protein [Cupriavidus necator]NOV28012.1 hypothetical protein [Cupriavidus necator]